jgi:hypothetical protein
MSLLAARAWPRSALAASFFLALTALASAQTPPPVDPPIPVGINLRSLTAHDRSWVFTDAMKMASEWVYGEGGRARPNAHMRGLDGKKAPVEEVVPLDGDGWPRPIGTRSVSCQFFVGMRGLFPAGTYVVTWKGKGKLEFKGGIGIVSEAPNRIQVNVDAINGGQPGIEISEVDPLDPIREVRVWLPDFEETCHSFHPLFVERLRPFSVLRFYPWMRVHTSSGRWSKRTTAKSARQGTSEGVAVEYMVELCNELAADPWFCIPHVADDDYVRRFATLVRDSLRHDAKVYVEFSNETWNTDFPVGRWARDEGRRRNVQAMQVVGERAARVFDIWHEVFGEQRARVVRVAGVQLHNPGVANSLCRALNGKFDALALGTYFGARADRDPVDQDSTPEELMAAARANLRNVVLPRIREHRTLADGLVSDTGRRVRLVTYEGGQSIVPRSPGGGLGLEAALACQEMPEMFTAYRELIDGAVSAGVDLFVGYDFVGPRNSADTFSVLEHIQEPASSAPKYRALGQGWESRGQ